MDPILARLFDARFVFSEHHAQDGERPEIYALHPEGHATVVEALGLEPDPRRGGHSRPHERLGRIGPTFVADRDVPPGTVRAWGDAAEYARRHRKRHPG